MVTEAEGDGAEMPMPRFRPAGGQHNPETLTLLLWLQCQRPI